MAKQFYTFTDRVYVIVDGMKWICRLDNRKRGLTFICANCTRGIVAREGERERKNCKVCGTKIITQYLPLAKAIQERKPSFCNL